MAKFAMLTICITVLFIASSCDTTGTNEKQAVKQNEDSLKPKKADSLRQDAPAKTNPPDSGLERLIGYWFIPHSATINIRFYRNKQFVFNDYNDVLNKEERLTGTFELSGNILTLYYEDRPKQKFRFHKGPRGDEDYYIESKGYYFAKGEEGD